MVDCLINGFREHELNGMKKWRKKMLLHIYKKHKIHYNCYYNDYI